MIQRGEVILGSVWIQLIFAETKNWNWKHCNEIIFKCVNSTVRPIFNEKVAESVICGTCEQCTGALFTINLSTIVGWTKKKKKREREKRRTQNTNAKLIWTQMGT